MDASPASKNKMISWFRKILAVLLSLSVCLTLLISGENKETTRSREREIIQFAQF